MLNLIRNPNINSNHLFRADILQDSHFTRDFLNDAAVPARILRVEGFELNTVMVRKLIPRNALLDAPLDQTCLIYSTVDHIITESLVIYLPHTSSAKQTPFYHPAVRGIGFHHTFNSERKDGVVSIHYSLFEDGPCMPILERTAQHLVTTLHRHGQGIVTGYKKRVHHDTIIPQADLQNTYSRLKAKHAKVLINEWVEVTDPTKHVFEDLGIAAFLIELWAKLYPKQNGFPGFVDIGCGNGLLVHLLIEEGYEGWGFDARKRKSWDIYSGKAKSALKELVLIPSIIRDKIEEPHDMSSESPRSFSDTGTTGGDFPKGTFIISNHADELTPWTPILATLSESPFIMIPCCSHNLTGAKFRAPAPKESETSSSTYASLVSWVDGLAQDCGWKVEKEMLRIPSTRNAALIGRERTKEYNSINIQDLIQRYGGADGWERNAMKLTKGGLRGHWKGTAGTVQDTHTHKSNQQINLILGGLLYSILFSHFPCFDA